MKKKIYILLIFLFIIFSLINLYADSMENQDEFPAAIEEEYTSSTSYQACDPLQPYNRMWYGFNDRMYFWVLKPTATGYSKVVPGFFRRCISRFFKNLAFPIRFVNSVLQFKFKKAGIETARFLINSTIGIAGFGDPAKKYFHLQTSPEDFGQTLGFYHFRRPWHLEWPFLGPSNTRDTIGTVGDLFLDPVNYIVANYWVAAAVYAFKKLNNISLHLGEYEKLKKESVDPYSFIRDLYEQNRIKLIKE